MAELTSGLLVALGFLGPIGPALMFSVMLVAMMQHWENGFFAMNNGIEVPLLYATAGLALAFTGPGAYSLDALLGLEELWDPRVALIAIAVGAVGALAAIAVRRPVAAAAR